MFVYFLVCLQLHVSNKVGRGERQTDGIDITLVALELAMSFALFLAKNLHLSFFPLKWR